LIYATYLGGAAGESGRAIAVDDVKNAYITGSTFSTDFPTVSPFQGALRGTADNAFVTKLDPSGTPIYSTYLGGTTPPQDAEGLVIAADPDGNAYVAGRANTGFPLVNPIQSTGSGTAFVSKLNADGSALLYSTFLGEFATPAGIAVDSARRTYVAGNVVVNGNTNPPGSLPLLSPIQNSFGTGLSNGFVTVLNSAVRRWCFQAIWEGTRIQSRAWASTQRRTFISLGVVAVPSRL